MSANTNKELKEISTAEKINLTQGSIDLPTPSIQNKKKENNSFFEEQSIESLRIEIYNLKQENKYLKKELQAFSSRLDEALKKHLPSAKKQKLSTPAEVSQMELQNAYKKCEIYKREVSFYKKKIDSFDDTRIQQFQSKIHLYAKENEQLRNQLKNIKKISKLQERGLEEVGVEGYVKINAENQKLKEEVKRLKKQLNNYVRQVDAANNVSIKNSGIRTNDPNTTLKSQKNMIKPLKNLNPHPQLQPIPSMQKKRLKTQHHIPPKEDDELLDFLQIKSEKDDQKIRVLLSDKSKLREMLDNAKIQIAEKQKEINYLKDKILNLRKNNALLLQKNNESYREISQQRSDKLLERRASKQKIKTNKRGDSKLSTEQIVQKGELQQKKDQMNELKDAYGKYPRVQDSGLKKDDCLKWNHHQFSSQIKQIQVLPSESGHIMDIHVRYAKGQPKKYDKSSGSLKYASFVCSESSQYIKYLSGGFKDGYLQYLILTTNSKRTTKFCKFELQNSQECSHFSFNISPKQYPAALFGESDNDGVTRIGCFIQKDQK